LLMGTKIILEYFIVKINLNLEKIFQIKISENSQKIYKASLLI